MSAVVLGCDGYTLNDFFEAAINALPGDPSGFAVSVYGKVLSQAVASATRRLFSQRGLLNSGWNLAATGTNTGVAFGVGGTNAVSSPTSTIAATEVGKLSLYTGVWDGVAGSARLYAKRVQVGAGTALPGGYQPDTTVPAMIGRRATDSPADSWAIFGVCYTIGIPAFAAIQSHFDWVMASKRMQHIPGMPGVLLDFTSGLAEGVPSVLIDKGTSGINFTRMGQPRKYAQYAHSWAW